MKQYVSEPGSEVVARLVSEEGPAATARLAAAEAHAAFARRWREGGISRDSFHRLQRTFDREWPAYLRVDLTEELLRRVRDLVRRHPLRGADAVHLASALALRDELATEVRFVASDLTLLAAAKRERLPILDPTL